jgi:hypothetical protein
MYVCFFCCSCSLSVKTVLSFFVARPCNTVLTQLNSHSTVNPMNVPVIRTFRGCLTLQTPLGYASVLMHWIWHRYCMPHSYLKPTVVGLPIHTAGNTFLIKWHSTLKLQIKRAENWENSPQWFIACFVVHIKMHLVITCHIGFQEFSE